MKQTLIEKFCRWYLNRYKKEKFFSMNDIGPAISQDKENEHQRVKKIHDAENEEKDRHHQLEIKIIKAESSAEIERMGAEMDIMLQKVRRAQDVYYDTIQKAKVTDSVVSDMATQAKHLRDMISTITGCMEGIERRAAEHIEALSKSEITDREQLSLPTKE